MIRVDPVLQQLLHTTIKREIAVPILTPRLELRPFQESDVDGIAELLADREATRFRATSEVASVIAEFGRFHTPPKSKLHLLCSRDIGIKATPRRPQQHQSMSRLRASESDLLSQPSIQTTSPVFGFWRNSE